MLIQSDVSVAISAHKAEKYIHACIESLLAQRIGDFEIIIVEDPPFDQTENIVNTFGDKRIRYVRNLVRLGLSASRNRSVRLARGKYIFFTDADCIVSENWIEMGLESLLQSDLVGVEGKTYYVSKDYTPVYSDTRVENLRGGRFMTCNIAYRKSVIERVGGFDERFTRMEDRDLALRAMRLGRIRFDNRMVVYHQKGVLMPAQLVRKGKAIRNRVLLYKRFGENWSILGRIVDPLSLIAIIFPPLILGSVLRCRYRTKNDFALLPFIYVRLVYERLNLWVMCTKERIFLF